MSNPATQKKLSLTSIPVQTPLPKLQSKPAPKEKVKKVKPEPCFIHIGKLKEHPDMIISQVRFTVFPSFEVCEEWCKEHLISYEIRSHKTEKTLIKIGK